MLAVALVRLDSGKVCTTLQHSAKERETEKKGEREREKERNRVREKERASARA